MSLDVETTPAKPKRSKRDPGATRASILAAARVEFAERGMDGARVEQIARRAKANKQLVYYYFGSKDELYKAALEATYSEIRALERQLDLATLPPREAMVRLIEFSFDYLDQHRDFIRLLADENAHGARHVIDSDMAFRTNSPLIELIGETLRRGMDEGEFRAGVDPLELYVSVAGMVFFYFANGLTLSAIFGRDLGKKASIESYRSHVVGMTLGGLQP
jgi:TetR/AcrR family transcriptional regulator